MNIGFGFASMSVAHQRRREAVKPDLHLVSYVDAPLYVDPVDLARIQERGSEGPQRRADDLLEREDSSLTVAVVASILRTQASSVYYCAPSQVYGS